MVQDALQLLTSWWIKQQKDLEGGPGCNSQQPIPVTCLLVPVRAQNLLKQDHLGTNCSNIWTYVGTSHLHQNSARWSGGSRLRSFLLAYHIMEALTVLQAKAKEELQNFSDAVHRAHPYGLGERRMPPYDCTLLDLMASSMYLRIN